MDPLLFQSQLDIINQRDLNKYKNWAERKEKKNPSLKENSKSFQRILSDSRKGLYQMSSEKISIRPNEKQIQDQIKNSPEKQKLFEAAREFEAFFVEKVFKEMKKNVPKTGWIDGGRAEEIFDDMLMTERVKIMSRHTSFGLAEQIYHQLMDK